MIVFEVIGMGAKKYGGFERYIVEEACQLKAKGHTLVVIFDRQPLASDYVSDLNTIGAIIEIVPQESRMQFASKFWHLLQQYHPVVVHTNFSSNLFVALPLARLAGAVRLIATEHCLPAKTGLKNRLIAQAITLIAQKVLPVSKMSENHLRQATFFGKKKIETLYLGVDDFHYDKAVVRKELSISDNTVVLMNIAYHNPVKGVDVLLEAFNIVINKFKIPNIVLYQIGGGQTGSDTELLRRQADELDIADKIIWMGIRNDVPKLLCAADIYIQPSRSEGIPLSIMEASLANLPIVATDVGGNSEAALAGINAIIAHPESPRELAEGIMLLYQNTDLRSEMGTNGRKLALDKFSLKNNVATLIERHYQL